MKKAFLLFAVGFATHSLQAQVGINTTDPKATLDIKEEAVDLVNPTQVPQGVSFPNFTTEERATFRNVKEGTMIYNTTKKCIEMYQGLNNGVPQWTCITAATTSGGGTNPGTGTGTVTISDKVQYVAYANYQGTLVTGKINNGAEKITLEIPYTNGQGDYNAVNITQTTAQGQGGDTNPLTLKIQPNTFNSTGNLTATIEVGGDGEYLLRQLAPGATYDIATFNVDINGSNFQVILKGKGGILDKKYGDGKHNFVYLPVEVTAPNGYSKTWLNMNLGAEAAKVGSSEFNPTMTKYGATGVHTTEALYGSLYQWQRPTDGHEFSNSGTTSTTATNWQATAPTSVKGKFIVNGNENWVSNGSSDTSGANVQLWQANKENNPCPVGYHVPTKSEWEDFQAAVTGARTTQFSDKMWKQTLLPNFAAAGFRYWFSGSFRYPGTYGYYWSSDSYTDGGEAWDLYFFATASTVGAGNRTSGFSVRCLQD